MPGCSLPGQATPRCRVDRQTGRPGDEPSWKKIRCDEYMTRTSSFLRNSPLLYASSVAFACDGRALAIGSWKNGYIEAIA